MQEEQLIEAISAELDGELESFAAELGRTSQDVASEIRVDSRYTTLREQLKGASTTLREDKVSLDELTKRRLVPTSFPSRTHYAWISAAAIVLVVFVAVSIGLGLRDNGRQETVASSDDSESSQDTPKTDFGDVTDSSQLRSLLENSSEADLADNQPNKAESGDSIVSSEDPGCATRLAADQEGVLVFSGTAIYAGDQAFVVGLSEAGRLAAYVVDESCTILSSASISSTEATQG